MKTYQSCQSWHELMHTKVNCTSLCERLKVEVKVKAHQLRLHQIDIVFPVIIWLGLFPARRQILERQSWVLLSFCPSVRLWVVRACSENLVVRFLCQFKGCFLSLSSWVCLSMNKFWHPLHVFRGRPKIPLRSMRYICLHYHILWCKLFLAFVRKLSCKQ